MRRPTIGIAVLALAGAALDATTDPGFADIEPTWSPDGTQIAYARQSFDGASSIWVIDITGANAHQITPSGYADLHPAWSPDGSEIAFDSDRSGGRDLWLVAP